MKYSFLLGLVLLCTTASANQLLFTGNTMNYGLDTQLIMLPDASVMRLREVELQARSSFYHGSDVLVYDLETKRLTVDQTGYLGLYAHTTHPLQRVAIYDSGTDYFYPAFEGRPYSEQELAYDGQVIYVGDFVPGYARNQAMDTPFQNQPIEPKPTPEPEPVIDPTPEPTPEPDPDPESDPAPEPESVSVPSVTPEPVTESDPMPDVDPAPETDPVPDTNIDSSDTNETEAKGFFGSFDAITLGVFAIAILFGRGTTRRKF